MTKLLQRVEITLRSFYIFNSSFGQREGEEHKKILYYYPNDIELNTKIKDVGLSEAIIAFTGTFTTDHDCKALHTQKTTQLFYQPEPGYWLVIVLNVPKEIRLKDGVEVADYRGGEVSDRIFRAVLRQCYNFYRFQYGEFSNKLTATNVEQLESQRQSLQDQLLQFYDKYLIKLKELSGNCDIMDMLHSIQYLALDKSLFLRAQNFSMLCATFPAIKECIMLYNHQVVCGGKLSAGDLYSLHAYIVEYVLSKETTPATNEGEGRFVSSVEDNVTQVDANLPPPPVRVHLSLGSHNLLIYRALNVTLCLFLDALSADQAVPKPEFYEELHAYMGPQLICLARDIANEICKENILSSILGSGVENASATADSSAPKYLFINEQSLQHHTNIYRHSKSLPNNVMSIIADLANPSESWTNAAAVAATEELQVKTTNDYWIVKRRCNWRQYYVILCNSKATLLDVTQEAKRIFELEFRDDVFFDK
ncbi:vacuolar fusion protein CCZ1 homolog [Drosophila tropicalis]|uniref:vacuolar fusion protein CCZ1 homolog n=1 Tax=Drosophila tropicalis TaxID=46794 RepID=UPI0035AB6F79